MEVFTPTSKQVFVRPISEEKKGRIVIPEMSRNSLTGEVLAIGSEIKEVKIGDIVLYDNRGFSNFRSRDGQKFFIMDERNIVCVLEE